MELFKRLDRSAKRFPVFIDGDMEFLTYKEFLDYLEQWDMGEFDDESGVSEL